MENVTIRLSIKTAVDLERDPVLGTRTLKLKDIFADQEAKVKIYIYLFFYSYSTFFFFSLKNSKTGFHFQTVLALVNF